MPIPLSVIIPVYRDAEALGRTLAATDFSGVELIVCATPDDSSLSLLRLAHPAVVWVDAPRDSASNPPTSTMAASGAMS